MPDFPTAVTDLPDAAPSETLFTMHGGQSHVTATNRLLANIKELSLKLGIGASAPGASAAVLRRTASGQSGWGQVAAGDVAGGNGGTVLGTQFGATSMGHRTPPTPAIHLQYTFDTTTTLAEPAAGRCRLNNAAPASATILMLSANDIHGYSTPGVLSMLTNAPYPVVRGVVRMQYGTAWSPQFTARITGIAALGAGIQIGLATPIPVGAFANNDFLEITIEPGGFDNPMIAAGDLIYGIANGQAERLPKGANSTVLGISAGGGFNWRQVDAPDLVMGTVSQSGQANATGGQTTTSTTAVAVTGSTVTLTTTGGLVLVFGTGALFTSAVGGFAAVGVAVDGVGGVEYAVMSSYASGAYSPFSLIQSFAPAAGSHTFRLNWRVSSGATATLNAALTTVVELKRGQ